MSDWNTVTILRKRPPKPSTMKSEQVHYLIFVNVYFVNV